MEAARRASLADEEVRQMRAVELAARRLAPEMWRQREALLIVLLLLRTLLRVFRLQK